MPMKTTFLHSGRIISLALMWGAAILSPQRLSAQETARSFQLPRADFVAGSYAGRSFLSPGNHLGEDSAHPHYEPVHAIANGIVRDSGTATGYGRVVVVEHKLPDGTYVTSISGHLCGHSGYPLKAAGSVVKKGEVIGYIGSDAENGDGREHLHLGIRKGAYDGSICGYSRAPHCLPESYHPPTEFINQRKARDR
jgi:murein DD-endopeptidase MepM/ murein hydrolase activator NlpD